MKNKIIIIILIIVIGIALYIDLKKDKPNNVNIIQENIATTTEVLALTEDDYMDISIYIQDKNVARTRDCGLTTKIEYTIPKTPTVTNTVLKILFADELKKYGNYDSVNVVNGVAKVMLTSDMTPEGKTMDSLSSCESGHLLSVLKDTLKQYESINSVELYSPKGAIMF